MAGATYLIWTNLADLDQGRAELAAACVAVGLALVWWGPSGEETRLGARAILRGLLPTAWARWLFALAALASAGVILAFQFR
ncbi:MAG: hypothetical protein LBG60_05760 [Bifidobacteriaceae bacterium]|nr:hypothetical protein [Bifidobacteriaceae bacterium]